VKKLKSVFGKAHNKNPGFTLFEVIVVLILMGILAAVAIPRLMDNTPEDRAAADKLKMHLRFAQLQALNSDMAWGIELHGIGYRLFSYEWDSETDTYSNKDTHSFPGEDNVIDLRGITVNNLPASFDNWGRPYNAQPPSGTNSGWTITVGSESITITSETGFIP
jgi:prepilin-type N-terminal cleavage/methylation domain-containing protein